MARPGAVAVGPQLATFAASLGIPTALVVGPQQDATVTATYPWSINVMGVVVASGTMTASTTERVE